MDKNNSEIFHFDNDIINDQILRTYIECVLKYNTLDWFLYYEDYFIGRTNTNLLNLSTSMKSISINENSTTEEIEHYFRYLKACHLGVEYIEHSLKLLLMLEGHDIKEIKKLDLEHDLKKHFEMLTDDKVKALIISSIGKFEEPYIESVLKGIPTNVELKEYTDEEKDNLDLDLKLIEKAHKEELFTKEEEERYEKLKKLMISYDEQKYDQQSKISNKYFNAILNILSNSFVDLRYPEISINTNYYNLPIILSICSNIRTALIQKIESSKIFESEKLSIEEYVSKIIENDEESLNYIFNNNIVILDRPLTLFEKNKMKASNKSKYDALMWYMYGMEEFYLTGYKDYYSSLGDILNTTSITREKVSKKSNDKAIYKNYLYYQACHMASDFIEHSLKLILLNNGYTYKEIKEQFGHDFKKMFYALKDTEQKEISEELYCFNENYLNNAISQNPSFRDVIKCTQEEKEEKMKFDRFGYLFAKRGIGDCLTVEELEYLEECEKEYFNFESINKDNEEDEKNKQELSNKYLDSILTQIADAFKYTRYPDFNNFNLDYKYCLKVLLAFAQGLQSTIEKNMDLSYFLSSDPDIVDKMRNRK